MRECAVCAVLDTVREYFGRARTFGHVVQRAVAEQAVEFLNVVCLVARKILAVSVTEKMRAVFHVSISFLEQKFVVYHFERQIVSNSIRVDGFTRAYHNTFFLSAFRIFTFSAFQ